MASSSVPPLPTSQPSTAPTPTTARHNLTRHSSVLAASSGASAGTGGGAGTGTGASGSSAAAAAATSAPHGPNGAQSRRSATFPVPAPAGPPHQSGRSQQQNIHGGQSSVSGSARRAPDTSDITPSGSVLSASSIVGPASRTQPKTTLNGRPAGPATYRSSVSTPPILSGLPRSTPSAIVSPQRSNTQQPTSWAALNNQPVLFTNPPGLSSPALQGQISLAGSVNSSKAQLQSIDESAARSDSQSTTPTASTHNWPPGRSDPTTPTGLPPVDPGTDSDGEHGNGASGANLDPADDPDLTPRPSKQTDMTSHSIRPVASIASIPSRADPVVLPPDLDTLSTADLSDHDWNGTIRQKTARRPADQFAKKLSYSQHPMDNHYIYAIPSDINHRAGPVLEASDMSTSSQRQGWGSGSKGVPAGGRLNASKRQRKFRTGPYTPGQRGLDTYTDIRPQCPPGEFGLFDHHHQHANGEWSGQVDVNRYTESGVRYDGESRYGRRRPSYVSRLAGYLIMTMMMMVLLLGAVGFLFATMKLLSDVTVEQIENVLASEQELMFDLRVGAINPNLMTIRIDRLDASIFAKSPHVGGGGDKDRSRDRDRHADHGDEHPPGPELHHALGTVNQDQIRIADDSPLDPPEEPGEEAQTMLLGRVFHLSSPLTYDGSPFNHFAAVSVGQVRLEKPGNKTDVAGSDRWERVMQHPFELIVRGVLKYELPLSGGVQSAKIDGSVVVRPSKGPNRLMIEF